MAQCMEELTYPNFYVSIFVEGLSASMLVFIGGISYVKYERPYQPSQVFEIAATYAIMLTVLSQCTKDVSNAHINPAITLANVLTRRVSLLRGFSYAVFQIIGAIIGASILKGMIPNAEARGLSVTYLAPDLTLINGIMYEIIFTFIYTWIHYASKNSRDIFKGFSGPMALGLFYGISHVVIVDFTGCSLNPARTLGPAFVKGYYNEIWIYIIGPLMSASLAGLLHDFVVHRSKKRPYPRARSCSVTCCKPGFEEIITSENLRQQHSDRSSGGASVVIARPDHANA